MKKKWSKSFRDWSLIIIGVLIGGAVSMLKSDVSFKWAEIHDQANADGSQVVNRSITEYKIEPRVPWVPVDLFGDDDKKSNDQ